MDFYLDWRNHINIGTSETLALAGEQVSKRKTVSANNKDGLENGLEKIITNPIETYKFIRNNKTFYKGQPPNDKETWKEFFTRLNKVLAENGENIRHFNQFESHHIFPVDLFKRASFRKWYESVGKDIYDINGKESLQNLIMLEAKRTKALTDKGLPNHIGGVHSKHNAYTEKIGDYFDKLWKDIKESDATLNDFDIAKLMNVKVIKLSENLKKSLIENSVKGTIELPTYWTKVTFEDLIK